MEVQCIIRSQVLLPQPRLCLAEPGGEEPAFSTVAVEPSLTGVPTSLFPSAPQATASFSALHLATGAPGCLGVDALEPKEMHHKKFKVLRMEILKQLCLCAHEVLTAGSTRCPKVEVLFYSILVSLQGARCMVPPSPSRG